MGSENPSGADNQQERLFTSGWLVGRAGRGLATRENFAKFVKASEVLRILRDHTPTLFPVSGEEDEMVRSLWRRREVVRNGDPPLGK
jgi:hypothetical protein